MTLSFYKYQGTGNDFIILDGRKKMLNLSNLAIKKLCDRKFGIGADGFMILRNESGFDFSMTYYNADGFEGSMCGNGGRCILAFANRIGIKKKHLYFLAVDGPHDGEIIVQNDEATQVRLKMSNVSDYKKDSNVFLLETGSPHYVNFTNQLDKKNVYAEGKEIRNSKTYADKGINVNFVEETDDHLFVRTYERGVENETLSCGTGVTAATLASALKNNVSEGNTQIQTLGGNLRVSFKKAGNVFTEVWLEGPATFVFKGEINIQ